MQKHLNSVAKRLGYRLIPRNALSEELMRRQKLLSTYQIDLVLDVGANIGQYGNQLRQQLGYRGRIVSFEPLSSAFKTLSERANGDALWLLNNFALGDAASEQTINIAANSHSSSLLAMLPAHEQAAPDSKYTSTERIQVKRLDSIFDTVSQGARNIWLKIDTQGFEIHVLRGAEGCLDKISTLQLELSIAPLYDGEMLYDKMNSWLTERNYSLVSIEPGFFDRDTGRLLQFDGIFHRY